MKYYLIITLAIALCCTGCGGAETNTNQPPQAANSAIPAPKPVYNDPLTPTDAFKAYNLAKRNKDAEGIKRFLSKNSIALSAKTAEQRGETLDAVLLSGTSFVEIPPVRNEKITGDTAVIEVQNPANGSWEEWFLIKEDGIWKNDLDRLIKNLQQRLTEAMKQSPANTTTDKGPRPSR